MQAVGHAAADKYIDIFHPPANAVIVYLVTLTERLIGADITLFALRAPNMILYLAYVRAIYILLSNNKALAVLIVAYAAISPSMIFLDSIRCNYVIEITAILWSIVFYMRYAQSKSTCHAIMFAFMTGITVFSGYFIGPPLAALALIVFVTMLRAKKYFSVAIFALIIIVFVAPLLSKIIHGVPDASNELTGYSAREIPNVFITIVQQASSSNVILFALLLVGSVYSTLRAKALGAIMIIFIAYVIFIGLFMSVTWNSLGLARLFLAALGLTGLHGVTVLVASAASRWRRAATTSRGAEFVGRFVATTWLTAFLGVTIADPGKAWPQELRPDVVTQFGGSEATARRLPEPCALHPWQVGARLYPIFLNNTECTLRSLAADALLRSGAVVVAPIGAAYNLDTNAPLTIYRGFGSSIRSYDKSVTRTSCASSNGIFPNTLDSCCHSNVITLEHVCTLNSCDIMDFEFVFRTIGSRQVSVIVLETTMRYEARCGQALAMLYESCTVGDSYVTDLRSDRAVRVSSFECTFD